MTFIQNRGQVPGGIDYYVQGAEASVGFSSDGILLSLADRAGTAQRSVLNLDFVEADRTQPDGLSRARTLVSYFKGDQEDWVTGVPTYSRVAYRDLWPAIDLVYSGTGSRLKYSFLVDPGADPADIRMAVSGATGFEVNARGQLEMATPAGEVVDDTPYSYQVIGGRRVEVPSAYALAGDRYGFHVGSYDPTRRLVIDPVMLIHAGYIGGAGGVADAEQGYGIAVDSTGAAYVTGITDSTEATFPDGDGFGTLSGPDTSFNGGADAFVAKVAPSGTSLVYAGYIGGASLDIGNDIAVDSGGAAYITGYTESGADSFPEAVGPDLTQNGSADAFVAKVASSGTSLDYAGYIGGSGIDAGHGIDVDSAGAAYVTGETLSTQATFPDGTDAGANGEAFDDVPGPDQTHNGSNDAFVAKVAASGTSLAHAGYIGGSGSDVGVGIAADSTGAAYVTGQAGSTEVTFPEVSGPDLTHNGGVDGFVAKVASLGTSLDYAGYIGGSGTDAAYGIGLDSTGAAYVTGETASTETTFPDGDPDTNDTFPAPGFDQSHNDATDAFVTKVSSLGTSLDYAGYIGGLGNDVGLGIDVDSTGAASVTGSVDSFSTQTTFPDGDGFGTVSGPDSSHNGGTDAFVANVASSGTTLAYAGYIGGSDTDVGNDIAVDATGAAYLAGHTVSTESTFPDGDGFGTVSGPDTTHNGAGTSDAFVAKVAVAHTLTVTKDGTGSGTVTSSPAGIDCGSDCTQPYAEGTVVTLTATPASGSTFLGWSGGGCSGTAPCMVTIDGDKAVTATFDLVPTPGPAASCLGHAATVAGTSANDTLTGTNGADVIVGLGGNDTITGLGGNDLICAGDGNDKANGGGGKDKVNGEGGNDKLKGAGGKDRLSGGPGKDTCSGGPGRDKAPGCEKKKSIP